MNRKDVEVYLRGRAYAHEMYARTADGITIVVPLPGIGPISWETGTAGEAQHRCYEALQSAGLRGTPYWGNCFYWTD
jgi:hypothetical protein